MRALQERLGYAFQNPALLENALTHSSYANERRGSQSSNERLEFLGDSILGMVTAEKLYHTFPHLPEGRLSRLRAELVCEQSLHAVALDLGLGQHLRLGKGEEHSGGRERPSILADAVEAVIAAMYLDGGIVPARAFILEHVLAGVEEGQIHHVMDYKTELQERIQRKADQHLRYELVDTTGPDHNKHFIMAVFLNDAEIGRGQGRSKKEAEQAAAKAALNGLEK